MRLLLKQRLATLSPVASRLWRFGTKNKLSMRHVVPRSLRSAEERELDIALANAAVSAPFYVAGSQRLREPLKLFLIACAKAAARAPTSQGSSGVNDVNYIEIGAGGLTEDALQELVQVGQGGRKPRYVWSLALVCEGGRNTHNSPALRAVDDMHANRPAQTRTVPGFTWRPWAQQACTCHVIRDRPAAAGFALLTLPTGR